MWANKNKDKEELEIAIATQNETVLRVGENLLSIAVCDGRMWVVVFMLMCVCDTECACEGTISLKQFTCLYWKFNKATVCVCV